MTFDPNRNPPEVFIEVFQYEQRILTITVLDYLDAPVDIEAKKNRFSVQTLDDPPTQVYEVLDVDIAVTGPGKNIASITVPTSGAVVPGRMRWILWNVDDDLVLAHGAYHVRGASDDV